MHHIFYYFQSEKPVVVEPFVDFPSLGRFVIRDMKKVVGIGIIKKLGSEYKI